MLIIYLFIHLYPLPATTCWSKPLGASSNLTLFHFRFLFNQLHFMTLMYPVYFLLLFLTKFDIEAICFFIPLSQAIFQPVHLLTSVFFFQITDRSFLFSDIRLTTEDISYYPFTASRPPIAVIKARIVVICILLFTYR